MLVLSIYAALQIIFESLPISSSTNVLVWISFLQRYMQEEISFKTLPGFDFLLHIPSLIISCIFIGSQGFALIQLYWNRKKWLARQATELFQFGIIVDALTTLWYLLWQKISVTFFPLWLGCFVTTLLLFSIRFFFKNNEYKRISWVDAVVLGTVQGLSFLPGISRLGSTVVVGIWRGFSWEQSFLLSLLVYIPLMGAAACKALWCVATVPAYKELLTPTFLLVCATAGLLSFCVLTAVFSMVKQRTLWKFGWYTGAVTLLVLWFSGGW